MPPQQSVMTILKAIIIHVHVPLHCTAWIKGESWSLVETHKPVASHFSRSTLCFGGVSLAVLAKMEKKKKSTPEDNSWQIAVKRSQEHLAFFSLSLLLPLFFLAFLPVQVLVFWIVLWGRSVELNVIQKRLSFRHWAGLRLHFHCLTARRPPVPTTNRQAARELNRIPSGDFQNKTNLGKKCCSIKNNMYHHIYF